MCIGYQSPLPDFCRTLDERDKAFCRRPERHWLGAISIIEADSAVCLLLVNLPLGCPLAGCVVLDAIQLDRLFGGFGGLVLLHFILCEQIGNGFGPMFEDV